LRVRRRLVIPRVIAGAVMFPVVVGMAMLAGMFAGWSASQLATV
jgi:ABC-type transporter Mla maintaining outer membrane lipid asymmetry permease subunit MlaE